MQMSQFFSGKRNRLFNRNVAHFRDASAIIMRTTDCPALVRARDADGVRIPDGKLKATIAHVIPH